MSTVSISKGCFVLKNKERKAIKQGNIPGNKVNSLPTTTKLRHDTYSELWNLIASEAKGIEEQVYCNLLKEVIQFVKRSIIREYEGLPAPKEIPAAALVTGINLPDHDTLFKSLLQSLYEEVTPHIAFLKSTDISSIQLFVQKVCAQIMGFLPVLDDVYELAESKVKYSNLNFSAMSNWYTSEICNKKKSPKKLKTNNRMNLNSGRPPLIIVLQDTDNFTQQILQDFVLISREYMSTLPLVFIFGISTSTTSIHRILPQTVTSCFAIERFQAQSSSYYLGHVIEKIIMTNSYPFKLGSKVFKLLEEIFLYHDFSVKDFMQHYKLCLLEHFYSNPVSILCCSDNKWQERIDKLLHDDLEHFRQLSSFMKFVESCSPKEQLSILTDDKEMKDCILKLLRQFHDYQMDFFPMLYCLNSITKDLPKQPLGHQIRELYGLSINHSVTTTKEYDVALGILRKLSREELLKLVEAGINYLQKSMFCSRHSEIIDEANKFVNQLRTLEGNETAEKFHDISLKKSDRFQLQKKLKQLAERKKQPSMFEHLRSEVINFFDTTFKKFLKPPNSYPMYEVFFFDSVKEVKHKILPAPRSIIQKALSNPQHYLQCKCCKIESSSNVSPSLPGISIAYKLYLECGKFINVYDWMQAFATLTQSSEDEEGKINKSVQAQFTQAVSELQFLGFIKATKRKKDHVVRLTWGSC